MQVVKAAATARRTRPGDAAAVRSEADRLGVEEQMRRVTESLEEAQRIAHLGSWQWEIETGALDWSDEVFRLFGFAPQEFPPTYDDFLACVHPDDRDLVAGSVERAVRDCSPYNIQFRALDGRGGERYIHAQGSVLLSGDRPIRMVGTVLDVTEQQRMLDALAASERLSRSVLDSMSSRTAVLDREGRVVATNRAWRRFAVEQGCEESLGLGSNYLAIADAAGHRCRGARESAVGIRAVLGGGGTTSPSIIRAPSMVKTAGTRSACKLSPPMQAGQLCLTRTLPIARVLKLRSLTRSFTTRSPSYRTGCCSRTDSARPSRGRGAGAAR